MCPNYCASLPRSCDLFQLFASIDFVTRPRSGTLIIPIPDKTDNASFGHIAGAAPLAHLLESMLEASHRFESVVVAAAERHAVDAQSVLAARRLTTVELVTVGGLGTRRECLNAGLVASTDTEDAVIHDVSRPLASWTVRNRVLDALAEGHDFVVPTLVVVDSVKAVDHLGAVNRTVDRSLLRLSQFPRGMKSRALRRALSTSRQNSFDELENAVAYGHPITTVDGDPDGFEVRTTRDAGLAEAIVSCRLAGKR
ncbi:IspD/TarI family cytidylyltransferase [Actinomycetes bacterium M1A6_2h]